MQINENTHLYVRIEEKSPDAHFLIQRDDGSILIEWEWSLTKTVQLMRALINTLPSLHESSVYTKEIAGSTLPEDLSVINEGQVFNKTYPYTQKNITDDKETHSGTAGALAPEGEKVKAGDMTVMDRRAPIDRENWNEIYIDRINEKANTLSTLRVYTKMSVDEFNSYSVLRYWSGDAHTKIRNGLFEIAQDKNAEYDTYIQLIVHKQYDEDGGEHRFTIAVGRKPLEPDWNAVFEKTNVDAEKRTESAKAADKIDESRLNATCYFSEKPEGLSVFLSGYRPNDEIVDYIRIADNMFVWNDTLGGDNDDIYTLTSAEPDAWWEFVIRPEGLGTFVRTAAKRCEIDYDGKIDYGLNHEAWAVRLYRDGNKIGEIFSSPPKDGWLSMQVIRYANTYFTRKLGTMAFVETPEVSPKLTWAIANGDMPWYELNSEGTWEPKYVSKKEFKK